MKKTLEKTRYQNMVLQGINRILERAFSCETEEELGRICLSVAEEVSGSGFGFIGEIREGMLNDIAISDPGWVACTMGDPIGHRTLPVGLKVHGIYGRVLQDGKGFFTNDPASHADRIGLPDGHPPLKAFIGVPLSHEGKTIGMIGLGNREGGYSQEHLEALEMIAPAITKSLVHRRSEAALTFSESKYRTLFNSIDEGFFLIDVVFDENDCPMDFYYVETNDAATRMLGQNYTGKRLTDISPSYEQYWFDIFGEVARTGKSVRLERYAEHDKRWYSFYTFKVGDAGGRRVGSIFKDITDRKRIEQDLRESEGSVRSQLAEIEAIYRSAPVGMCVFDKGLRYVRINDRLAEINGIPPEEHIGKALRDVVPDLADMAERIADRIFRTGKAEMNVEFSGTTQSLPGAERYWLEHWLPLKSPSGTVVGINVVAEEITERKQAEEALRESEAKYRNLFENMAEGFFLAESICDESGKPVDYRYLDANLALEPLTGLKREEIIGRRIREVLPGVEEHWIETYGRVALTRKPARIEEFAEPLGRYYRTTAYSPRQGQFACLFEDITEQKKAEAALRESAERLRLAKSSGKIGIHDFWPLTGELYWDDYLRELWGLGPDDPVNYDVFISGLHPDDREATDEALRRALGPAGDGRCDIEYRLVRDGQTRWIAATGQARFEDGRAVRFTGTVQDITESKRMEEEQLKSETEFRLLSEVAGRLLASAQPQQLINELCQKVMEHLEFHVFFNFLADERMGRLHLNAYAGIPDEEARKIEWLDFGVAVCGCVAQEGVRIIAEDILNAPDIRTELVKSFGIQAYACHPLMIQKKVIGTLSFGTKTRSHFSQKELSLMRTVTDQVATAMERMRLIEELRRSRDELDLRVHERTAQLERKNLELQEFAFVASHDLSEPLRKIQTFGDLLKAKGSDHLSGIERDYINRMTGAANRMQELLDALLRYSRVDTKGQEFRPSKLDEAVRDAVKDLELPIQKIEARVEIGQLPIINCDPYQWRQLFQNLIANSLKYYRSEVKPLVRVYGEEKNGHCRIFVEDNGIGFDEKYLDKIFQPFQRLHGRNEYPGTGIGLAICKKIVERHGGTITAKSTPGKGSTFIITLPVDGTKSTKKPE